MVLLKDLFFKVNTEEKVHFCTTECSLRKLIFILQLKKLWKSSMGCWREKKFWRSVLCIKIRIEEGKKNGCKIWNENNHCFNNMSRKVLFCTVLYPSLLFYVYFLSFVLKYIFINKQKIDCQFYFISHIC